MLLTELLEQIPGIDLTAKPQIRIQGIAYDSRLVKEGYLFVAMKGQKFNGVRFIAQAISRGAAAVASEEAIKADVVTITVPDARKFLAQVSRGFYLDPPSHMKLVGITGTNGKTTTAYLLNSIYQKANLRSCQIGTTGMKIGSQVFPSERTTPESSCLMMLLRHAVIAGCTHGAIEVSSHALALDRVFGTKFTIGVFTNLTQDHLDFHKDMESYYQAKRLLFSAENDNRIESAIINIDDPYGQRLAREVRCPVVRFGFSKEAEVRVLECQSRAHGTNLILAIPQGELNLYLRLIGHPNVYNAMAAIGAALCLGIDMDSIHHGIEALEGVPGRMELIDAGQSFTVIVDYAHTPDALENLLKTVSQLPRAKLITVFGCGGDRDRRKRPLMGEIATRLSDYVIATSDNPRTEDPLEILREIESGLCQSSGSYKLMPDRREAIGFAVSMALKGDIVVIAGKGHEDYQIIGNRAIPFDDRTVAWDMLRELANAQGAQG